MKWIDNEKSENYLVGFSKEDQAYVVIKKIKTKNGIKLRIVLRNRQGYLPVPSSVDPEDITIERALSWYSLKHAKKLGEDAEGNEISIALIPHEVRQYILGYYFVLISECDKWILDKNTDPLDLTLEQAKSKIKSYKDFSGYKIIKKYDGLKIIIQNKKHFICKDNQKYLLPENIDAKSLELKDALQFIEKIENQKRIKEEIIEQYHAFPRMNSGEIIGILNSDVFENPKYAENLNAILNIMVDNKVEFFSPGGSFKRKIWQSLMHILEEKSDLRKKRFPNYIISEDFRDNIIPILNLLISKRKNKYIN